MLQKKGVPVGTLIPEFWTLNQISIEQYRIIPLFLMVVAANSSYIRMRSEKRSTAGSQSAKFKWFTQLVSLYNCSTRRFPHKTPVRTIPGILTG
jgi:hypothetical protein